MMAGALHRVMGHEPGSTPGRSTLFGSTWPEHLMTVLGLLLAMLAMLDGIARGTDGDWTEGLWATAWSADVPREQWFAHRIQWDAEYRAELGIEGPPHDYGLQ